MRKSQSFGWGSERGSDPDAICPKPMEKLNRPIAEIIFYQFAKKGLRKLLQRCISTFRCHANILLTGQDWRSNDLYAVEEDHPLRTLVVQKILNCSRSNFFISGDSITDFDLTGALKFTAASNPKATLILIMCSQSYELQDYRGR